MRSQRRARVCGVALFVVGTVGCGRLSDGNADPSSALGVVTATVKQLDPDRPVNVSDHVELALFWRAPASHAPTLNRAVAGSAVPSECVTLEPYVPASCSGIAASGRRRCAFRGEREPEQPVRYQLRGLAFEVPLRERPPPAALYDLRQQGGRGWFALASLRAFVDADGDGALRFGTPLAAPERVVADSAYLRNSERGERRRSYLVAFLDGQIALENVPPELADLALALPQGFSVWVEDEWIDSYRRRSVLGRTIASIEQPIELTTSPEIDLAPEWCGERLEDVRYVPAISSVDAPLSCSEDGRVATWLSSRWTGTCTYETLRYEGDYSCAAGMPPWNCPAPVEGLVQVSVAPPGADPVTGYAVAVDGGARATVGSDGNVTLGVSAGEHTVTLGGVPPNCSVKGENPVAVTVVRGGVASARFEVRCVSTTRLRITTVTTGASLDSGYTLTGAGVSPTVIGPNDSTVLDLGPTTEGWVTLNVGDIAWNCTAADIPGESRDVSVWLTQGQLSELLIPVECAGAGRIRVATTTSGAAPEWSAFVLELSALDAPWEPGSGEYPGFTPGTMLIGDESGPLQRLPAGHYRARLAAFGRNCVPSPDEMTFEVGAGATVELSFELACATTRLRITTVTTGEDLDDGYVLASFDQTIGANDSMLLDFGPSREGSLTVDVGDIAWNCTAADVPGESRSFSVMLSPGQLTDLAVPVRCTGIGQIRVTTMAPGAIPIVGFWVGISRGEGPSFDWGPWYYRVPANGAITIGDGSVPAERILAGTYSARLQWIDARSNCELPYTPPFVVVAHQTADVRLETVCHPTTVVRIGTVTTGAEPDDEYVVTVTGLPDEIVSLRMASNDSVEIDPLSSFKRTGATGLWFTVTVGDVAPNCAGPGPLRVWVVLGQATEISVPVQCTDAGRVRVTTVTSGDEPDPDGFGLVLSGGDVIHVGPLEYPIPPNGTVVVAPERVGEMLPVGSYDAYLAGVARNCDPSPARASFQVLADGTTDLAFDVRCPRCGTVRVAVTTSGTHPDADGYVFELARIEDPGTLDSTTVSAQGTGAVGGLHAGTYRAHLVGVAPNCDASPVEATFAVLPGEATDVAFDVTCRAPEEIAFTSLNMWGVGDGVFTSVMVVAEDGTGAIELTGSDSNASDPAWSPDGGRLAFSGDGDGTRDIYVMNEDGSSVARITTDPANDGQPAWSPDGVRIAFVSDRDGNADIYVMNADGTGPARLTNDTTADAAPAWSPDGRRIAFARGDRLYLMNADGSGVARLRPEEVGYPEDWYSEADPDWSPDGSRIAFTRRSHQQVDRTEIYVALVDGSSAAPFLGTSGGSDPSWSRNGSWIVFVREMAFAGELWGSTTAIVVAGSDGSSRDVAVADLDWRLSFIQPAWRRTTGAPR